MFKGLGNLGNIANIMQQAQQMGGRMEEINGKLKSERVQGTAGGGMVEVEVNGLGEVLRLTIEPSLVEKSETGMIEDLVPAAINQAQAKAKQMHADAMKTLTEGINLPGLGDAISKFTGTEPGDSQ